jgi:hypothetical protein
MQAQILDYLNALAPRTCGIDKLKDEPQEDLVDVLRLGADVGRNQEVLEKDRVMHVPLLAYPGHQPFSRPPSEALEQGLRAQAEAN